MSEGIFTIREWHSTQEHPQIHYCLPAQFTYSSSVCLCTGMCVGAHLCSVDGHTGNFRCCSSATVHPVFKSYKIFLVA